jgi:fatty-acyl-CoA synthase
MPVRIETPAANAYRYPLLIKQLLHTPRATALRQEIVYRSIRRHSYQDLFARIDRLASGLASLQVEQGETVAVMDWDSHRYLECFFAIPMMGAVLQTVNVRLSPDQIAFTLQHAAARLLLIHRDFLPLWATIRDRLPELRTVVLLDDEPTGGPLPADIDTEYEALLERSTASFEYEDFDENAVATTFYTTGTTGDPKGVCFSHRQIVLHALAVLGACGSAAHGQSFRHGDVYMPMTPMFHVHAWGNPFVATMLGVKQVYPGRYVPEELLQLRQREGVTYSHCVPTILQMLMEAADRTGADMAGWKMCIGGSALSVGLARAALQRGIDVYAGYGMSETGPVMSVSRLLDPPGVLPEFAELERRCRAGLPVPLVDLKIVDPSGTAVARDGEAIGEVVVRAPWTTPCYVGNPEASKELWRGGYLHTQDVGSIDANGYLQLKDRIKDVIKTGGEWISSLTLESLISTHPGVQEVAVVALSDARWGERPHALVVPRVEWRNRLTANEIQNRVGEAVRAGTLPKYAIPERVTFVDTLDKTSVGKINKRLLRDRYG